MWSILMDFKFYTSLFIILFNFSCYENKGKSTILKGFALGTSYNIKYSSSIPKQEVQKGIDSLLNVLNTSLSTYLTQSDISKINSGDNSIVVDEHFINVFKKTTEVWKATDGFFDPTSGSLVNAYGFGPEKPINNLTQKKIDSLLLIIGWEKISLLPDGRVKKKHPNIFIDFNAVAKGYIVDVIGNYLEDIGNNNFLVEIGGEVLARGISPKTNLPWKIGIENPKNQTNQISLVQTLRLKDEAMASSGNYRKYRDNIKTGERFVHIVNPKNGLAFQSKVLSVSVKAPDCITADAWATALMVMSLEDGKEIIENITDLEALWIIDLAGKNKIIRSSGF